MELVEHLVKIRPAGLSDVFGWTDLGTVPVEPMAMVLVGVAGVAERPRITFHFTPTSASWINQVETWFGTGDGAEPVGRDPRGGPEEVLGGGRFEALPRRLDRGCRF